MYYTQTLTIVCNGKKPVFYSIITNQIFVETNFVVFVQYLVHFMSRFLRNSCDN